MKRWIHAATESPRFKKGDKVTVFENVGYANYEAEFVEYSTNRYGVEVATVVTPHGKLKTVHPAYLIPSQKDYFYSLSRDDVLTLDFVAKLTNRDDSMFCRKVSYPRVDTDPGMENVTGADTLLSASKPGNQLYRVVIVTYISKHRNESRDVEDVYSVSLNDPIIQDALDILKQAPEFYVNFAGYQRTFKR